MESLPLALQREICSFAAAPELIPHEVEGRSAPTLPRS